MVRGKSRPIFCCSHTYDCWPVFLTLNIWRSMQHCLKTHSKIFAALVFDKSLCLKPTFHLRYWTTWMHWGQTIQGVQKFGHPPKGVVLVGWRPYKRFNKQFLSLLLRYEWISIRSIAWPVRRIRCTLTKSSMKDEGGEQPKTTMKVQIRWMLFIHWDHF